MSSPLRSTVRGPSYHPERALFRARHAAGSVLMSCVFLLALAACDSRQPVAVGGAAALARNLAHASAVEIHVDEERAAEGLRRLAALERARSGRDVRVLVASSGDSDAARIVVGTPGSASVTALAGLGGIALERDTGFAFRVADVTYDRPADLVRATFEDPERPGLPVTVWIGNDLDLIVRQIEEAIPRAIPLLATWRGGDPALTAELWPEGGMRSRTIERIGLVRSVQRAPTAAFRSIPGFQVDVPVGLDEGEVERILLVLTRARERASAWTSAALPDVAVRLSVMVDEYRLSGEHANLGRWNRVRPSADMLVVAGATDGGAAAVRAGMRAALGPAVIPWIEEGASVAAAGSWFGRDLERWLACVATSGRVPQALELVDPASDRRISAHALAPLRAALFEHLRAARGDGFVRALWIGTRMLTVDEELETAFRASLLLRVEPLRAEIVRRAQERRAEVLSGPPELGAAFIETSVDPRRGYGSRGAQQSLVDLAAAGAGTVLLRADFVESILPVGWQSPRPWAPVSGDVALFTGLLQAHASGLATMLSVNVLTSDAGSYSGDSAQDGVAAWQRLFALEARAVEHAGYLANLADAEWLCVGTALRATSAGESDDRRAVPQESVWKREGWSAVIGAARGAFPGAITYATADVYEAEGARFLGDLDAIGIELAPSPEPHSLNPRADLAAKMAVALDGIGAIARGVGKPVLVTHASFSPIRADGTTVVRDDWRDASLILFGDALLEARGRGVDIRGAWVSRVATDSRDPGFGARDSRFGVQHLEPFHARFREEFRTGARSPR